MTGGSSLSETVTALASSFTGQLLLPGDADYDEARKVHNGLIDKRPALIARCRGLADIVDAVKMARDQKARSRRPGRRSPRRGVRHDRPRHDDRPFAHEGHSRRSEGPHCIAQGGLWAPAGM